jgi:secreted trypsin-like serine protease
MIVQPTYQVLYSCNSTAVCGCSENSASVTKIVGGEAAGTATWGWAVSLSVGGNFFCGGSVISSSWIITAAHCFISLPASVTVTIYAGSNQVTAGQSRVVSQIFVHPNFDQNSFVNDITLLKLSSPLNMSDPAVSSICLPSVDSTTLAAGEWPPANTSVSPFLFSNPVQSLSTGCSSWMG